MHYINIISHIFSQTMEFLINSAFTTRDPNPNNFCPVVPNPAETAQLLHSVVWTPPLCSYHKYTYNIYFEFCLPNTMDFKKRHLFNGRFGRENY